MDCVRDFVGHSHHQAEPGILQHEIFHKPADIHNAVDMHVADGRKILVDSGTGPYRTVFQLHHAHVGKLSEACVYGYNVWGRETLSDFLERFLQIHGVHGLVQCTIDMNRTGTVLRQS